MNRRNKYWLLLVILGIIVVSCNNLNGQSTNNYPFINYSDNNLQGNLDAVKPLFHKLHQMTTANTDDLIVPIVHIGDSHLQVGILTMEVMTTLQKRFGNAGRGFISPLKLAKTSQHSNYNIESNNKWLVSRVTQTLPPFTVGLGGFSVRCLESQVNLSISTKPESGLDYSFNRIKLFKSPTSPTLSTISNGKILKNKLSNSFIQTYILDNLSSQTTLRGKNDSSFDLYGLSLENGKSGILYHNISIHTTRYANYAAISSFGEQINALSPELIIISLGTNEAFYKYFSEAIFLKEVESLISTLKNEMPETAILLTTPMAIKKRVVKNKKAYIYDQPNIVRIRNTIIKYANDNKLIYWDAFFIMGGENAPTKWVNAKLMSNDHIHLTATGSRLQGKLLVQSIINAYNNYVSALPR